MSYVVLAIVGIEQFSDFDFVQQKVDTYLARMGSTAQLIISGDSPGPNQMAKDYAINKGLQYQQFPADWQTDGKSAPYRRDERILNAATHIVFIHDGKNPFTADFINKAFAARKNVLRIIVTPTADTYKSSN